MNHLSEQQINELEKDGEKFYQYSLLGGLLDKAYNKVKENR